MKVLEFSFALRLCSVSEGILCCLFLNFDPAADEEWRRMAAVAAETQRLLSPGMQGITQMRTSQANPLGAPLILPPRMQTIPSTAASILNGSTPGAPLLSPADAAHGLIFTPYTDYANFAALAGSTLLTDYSTAADHSGGLFVY